jgi:hypothetical protein
MGVVLDFVRNPPQAIAIVLIAVLASVVTLGTIVIYGEFRLLGAA